MNAVATAPTTAFRTVVVDDEPLARKRLARLLRQHGLDVRAECEDVPALLATLEKGPVDVLFLDIEMPGGTGMEAMAEIPKGIPVVFVTAHAEHAARAFDADAVDYVLKPIFEDRLLKSIEKVKAHLARQSPAAIATTAGGPDRFPAKAGAGHLFLDFKRVSHFELDGQAVHAWCGGKRFRTPWDSLAEVETAFPGKSLVRIQRHLLLRPEAVIGIRSLPKGRAKVRVAEAVELEVSRSVTPRLREMLGLAYLH